VPEISNGWALLGLVAVLIHQAYGQWIARRLDAQAVGALKQVKSELTECRARWDHVEERLGRLESALSLLARGTARPPESHEP
jgi:hypothetical protein